MLNFTDGGTDKHVRRTTVSCSCWLKCENAKTVNNNYETK